MTDLKGEIAVANGNNVAAHPGNRAVSLRFTGQAGEYFSIWIVNVCLSIVTLGIYSAWAKVRRKSVSARIFVLDRF